MKAKTERVKEIRERLAIADNFVGGQQATIEIIHQDVPYLLDQLERCAKVVEAARVQVEANHNAMVVICEQAVKIDRRDTDATTVAVFRQLEAADERLRTAIKEYEEGL